MARKKRRPSRSRGMRRIVLGLSVFFLLSILGQTKLEAGIRNPALFAATIPIFALTFTVIGVSLFTEPSSEKEAQPKKAPLNPLELRQELSVLELQAISRRPWLHDSPSQPR